MTDSDKLRVLANWFDIYDEKLNGANDNSWVKRPNEVQQDLRRIADELEKLKTVHSTVMTGWLCPRCRTIHGPFVNQCHCKPETISRTTL